MPDAPPDAPAPPAKRPSELFNDASAAGGGFAALKNLDETAPTGCISPDAARRKVRFVDPNEDAASPGSPNAKDRSQADRKRWLAFRRSAPSQQAYGGRPPARQSVATDTEEDADSDGCIRGTPGPVPKTVDDATSRQLSKEAASAGKYRALLAIIAAYRRKQAEDSTAPAAMSDETLRFLIEKAGVTIKDLLIVCVSSDCPVPEVVGEAFEPLEGGARMADSQLAEDAADVLEAATVAEHNECLVQILRELLKWRVLVDHNPLEDEDEEKDIERTMAIVSVSITFIVIFVVLAVFFTNSDTQVRSFESLVAALTQPYSAAVSAYP
ncbi:hypothetical protein DIPPA_31901 [Diplonema papillatum]|nr:hypothetical protein DIPPA_31901 [Diplonema papillatum]